MRYKQLTAIIHKEDDVYVSLCPELDIASQGENIEEAKDNLKESVELFFECASKEEVNQRSQQIYISEKELYWFQVKKINNKNITNCILYSFMFQYTSNISG